MAATAWLRASHGTDPRGRETIDPENRIIFAAGPLTGTSAANSGRATVCSLSPQAYPYEWFTYSSFGGYWGPTLKYVGYDAVVVQGRAERPVYLWVNDGKVELRDTSDLWGQGFCHAGNPLTQARQGCTGISHRPGGRKPVPIDDLRRAPARPRDRAASARVGREEPQGDRVRGTGGIALADPAGFSECTLAVAKEMHAPSGCPKWSCLEPQLVMEQRERFYACSQRSADPVCRLSRYCDTVPGVVYSDRKYRVTKSPAKSRCCGAGARSTTGRLASAAASNSRGSARTTG